MKHIQVSDARNALVPQRRNIALAASLVTLMVASAVPGSAAAADAFCSQTAAALRRACGYELLDDYWVAVAICTNETESEDRRECLDDADAARTETRALCAEQLEGRLSACKLLGEERYDPRFEPWQFDADFSRLTRPNRYYPLGVGNRWEYWAGTDGVQSEFSSVEILNEFKLIDEVTCVVVRDLVYEADGKLKEATDDWLAQAKNGDVWYCGEEAKNYEFFAGDQPQKPELVSIDGSFKADVDGAEPGILFKANPVAGRIYREEFSLGNAEDVAQIFSRTYHYGEDPELDRFVPPALAQLLCRHDCVVTENFSLLEPGVVERKYYAPDVGMFLETEPDSGEITRLVNCSFQAVCASLPAP